MISSIRKHAKGWLGIALLVLIGLPFAFSGVYSYVGGGGVTVVAKVNDREISERDYQRAYQEYRSRLQAMLGANFRPELIDDRQLRRDALERLIDEIVLTDASLELGYRVSSAMLARQVTGTPQFQTAGRFDRETYLQRLAILGATPESYEESLRNDLLIRQMLDGIRATALVTDRELQEVIRLQEQRRDLRYAVLPVAVAATSEPPTPEALQGYFDSHGDAFMRPEQVSLDYLELGVDRLMQGIAVDEAALRQQYQADAGRYAVEEERRARHILIAVAPEADEQVRGAALAKATSLHEQLAGGADFAALANSASDDPGSAAQGGDLGFFGRGIMDPSFEAAAFSLPLNRVSDPVLSAFGYHLIEVTEVRGGERKSFDEVRDTLAEEFRRRQAEELFFEQVETLASQVYEHPESLDAAAEALHLTVERTPWLTRSGGDWPLAVPRVIDAAFSAEVLAEGVNSAVIELANDHVVVLRLAEHRPARKPELAEVQDELLESYRRQQAREAAQQQGEGLLGRLREGVTLAALAGAEGLEPVEVKGLRRNDSEHPAPVVSAAFKLKKPAAGQTSIGHVVLSNGDFVLLELTGVEDGVVDSFAEEERRGLRTTLGRVVGNSESGGLLLGLRSRAEIRVNTENLTPGG